MSADGQIGERLPVNHPPDTAPGPRPGWVSSLGRVGKQTITDTGPLTRERMTVLPAAAIIQQHANTFADFPPRQAPPDFNPQGIVDAALHARAND